ncbi:hypothetical protein EIP86_009118 [Pleurotus ostreatoroseus]|nr:hypothetical protein EIP86_009118 [Pleurotus ostreatoroseus]
MACVHPYAQEHDQNDYLKDDIFSSLPCGRQIVPQPTYYPCHKPEDQTALQFWTVNRGVKMLGLQLSEASKWQCEPKVLYFARHIFPFEDMSLVINWPGRRQSLTKIDTSNVEWAPIEMPGYLELWKMARLVADEVHKFLTVSLHIMAVDSRSRAAPVLHQKPPKLIDSGFLNPQTMKWDISGGNHPSAMERLYLVELRLVNLSVWQPVLAWSKG